MRDKFFLLLMAICFALVYLIQNKFIQFFPSVDYNLVRITSIAPEMDFDTMEELVTIPIENKIKHLEGIKSVYSTTIKGRSEIIIQDRENTNNFEKISSIIPELRLPVGNKTEVIKIKSEDNPILQIFIKKDKEVLPNSNETCDQLKRQIEPIILNKAIGICESGYFKVNGEIMDSLKIFLLPEQDITVIEKIKIELESKKESLGLIYFNETAEFVKSNIFSFIWVLISFLIVSCFIGFFQNRKLVPVFIVSVMGIFVLTFVVLRATGKSMNIISIYTSFLLLPFVIFVCYYFIFVPEIGNKLELKSRKFISGIIVITFILLLVTPLFLMNGLIGNFIFHLAFLVVSLVAVTVIFTPIMKFFSTAIFFQKELKRNDFYFQFLKYFNKSKLWTVVIGVLPIYFFIISVFLIFSYGKFKLFSVEKPIYRIKLIATSSADKSTIEKETIQVENYLRRYNQSLTFFISKLGEIKKDENDPYSFYGPQFGQITIYFKKTSADNIKKIIGELKEYLKLRDLDVRFDVGDIQAPVKKPIWIELVSEDKNNLQEVAVKNLEILKNTRGILDPKLFYSDYEGKAARRKDFKPMIEVIADVDYSVVSENDRIRIVENIRTNLPKGVLLFIEDKSELEDNFKVLGKGFAFSLLLIICLLIYLSHIHKNIFPFFCGVFLPFLLLPNSLIISLFFQESYSFISFLTFFFTIPVIYIGFLVLLENMRIYGSTVDGALASIYINIFLPLCISIVSSILYFALRETNEALNSFFLSIIGIFLYQVLLLGIVFPVIFMYFPYEALWEKDTKL